MTDDSDRKRRTEERGLAAFFGMLIGGFLDGFCGSPHQPQTPHACGDFDEQDLFEEAEMAEDFMDDFGLF